MTDTMSSSTADLPTPLRTALFPPVLFGLQSQASASGSEISRKRDEPTIDQLVEEFRMYGKLAAEHHVRRSIPLARAKRQGPKQFKNFCERVGLKPESSTARKYLQIGKEAEWLLTISTHLPPEWTTIFAITVIGQVGALRLVEAGALHPQVTGGDLKRAAALHLQSPESTSVIPDTIQSCVLKICVSDRSDKECLQIYETVKKAVAPLGLNVTGLPKHLSEVLIHEKEAAK